MIQGLSQAVLKWLLHTGAISDDDKELYGYAIYSFLFSMIPLCLVIVIGAVGGMLTEGILMIIPFILIRKFSGGFHLKSSKVCFISSVLFLSLSLLLIKTVMANSWISGFFWVASLSALQIFFCSPKDSEARKLDEKENIVFRRVARVMVSIFWISSFLLLALDLYQFAVPICTGIIITALLQLPCVFVNNHYGTTN